MCMLNWHMTGCYGRKEESELHRAAPHYLSPSAHRRTCPISSPTERERASCLFLWTTGALVGACHCVVRLMCCAEDNTISPNETQQPSNHYLHRRSRRVRCGGRLSAANQAAVLACLCRSCGIGQTMPCQLLHCCFTSTPQHQNCGWLGRSACMGQPPPREVPTTQHRQHGGLRGCGSGAGADKAATRSGVVETLSAL